jgi:cytochrome P450
MLGPAFAIQHITNMRPMVACEAMKFRSRLNRLAEAGEEFRLEKYAVHLTFDVIGKATFSQSLEAQTEGKGSPAMDHFEEMCRAYMIERSTWNVVKKLLARRKMRAAGKRLDAVVATLVKKRFDVLQREKIDTSNKKGLCIMDLILRDYFEETPVSGKKDLDSTFLTDPYSR